MFYYAVEYKSGKRTTWGMPNKHTGRLSIACDLKRFPSRSSRESWVLKGKVTADMAGSCREPVTLAEAKRLHRGLAGAEFTEFLRSLVT